MVVGINKMNISSVLDRFINLLKWPIAIYMVVCLPALFSSFKYFELTNLKTITLICGLICFIFAKTMMDASVKTSMQIIAHEFTHAFFAFITFHKVKHIRLNPDESGGEMGFIGDGNWLIVIAPYFFPIFVIVFILITFLFKQNIIFNGILGYFVGYHIDTVASQIHEKQTDLPKVGYPFCFCFLPGANLWIIGLILAYNAAGLKGISSYYSFINHLNVLYFNQLTVLIKSLY